MPREPRNIGASVRARLLDRARAERSDFQIPLIRYALERLLYRLSVSAYRERFILKGAMLFVTWVTDPFRPTRDLDLLGHGDNDVGGIADTGPALPLGLPSTVLIGSNCLACSFEKAASLSLARHFAYEGQSTGIGRS